ncbi:MAG: formylglycine-generating enzyme family protein [Ignavibacteria bacterium]|jgi:formylglycine-generating enzyme required for sulfatase activity
MLLSYIDFLVDKTQIFENTYQIYDTLIRKWIEREAAKRKHKSEDREKFKRDLYNFSRFTALEIYKKRKENNLISKEEAKAICEANNIDLTEYEIMGQSLLTRDVSQNWKFAHKSILEFFIAKEAVKKFEIYCELAKSNFTGWDMVQVFYDVIGQWIFMKGGTFEMGDNNLNRFTKPVHRVTVEDFYISKTLVTQKQWRDVMDNNPSYFKNCDDCPVENVSWDDAQDFINKLNGKTGLKFRLPTEAEWEYAARGGNKSKGYKYSGSKNLDEVGWYNDNSERKTHAVAAKKPNELGIYDMSGNVWEWCLDTWHDNYNGAPTDGSAWEKGKGSFRVLRGGSWINGAEHCRVAYRFNFLPENRDFNVGIRLVLVP